MTEGQKAVMAGSLSPCLPSEDGVEGSRGGWGLPLPPASSLLTTPRSLLSNWGAQDRCVRPQLLDGSFISWCHEFLELGTSSPLGPAPLSGRDRCEELAVGTNAVTGTGTKEEDRV